MHIGAEASLAKFMAAVHINSWVKLVFRQVIITICLLLHTIIRLSRHLMTMDGAGQADEIFPRGGTGLRLVQARPMSFLSVAMALSGSLRELRRVTKRLPMMTPEAWAAAAW